MDTPPDNPSLPRRTLLRAAAATGAAAAASTVTRRARAAEPNASGNPIEHIVVLMMENRSFDSMLGRLPGADGLRRGMYNTREDGSRVYVHRKRHMLATVGDLNHEREGSLEEWNHGANDGFVRMSGPQAMGYLSPAEVPFIYALARRFSVFDRWHASLLAPTWPNRQYFHAGTSGGRLENDLPDTIAGFPERTVWEQLDDAGVSWATYFTDLPFTALYTRLVLKHPDRFRPIAQFYADAAAGNLPQVTVVEPGFELGTDDHPPVSVGPGQRFMHDVVHACTHSPLWPKTALLITYDEHGGFHDHVALPPMPDDRAELGAPIGFRVPSILVSPWARAGFVGHRVHDHTSATKLIQWRFGLGSLNARNAAANPITYAFDFSKPRLDVPHFPVPVVDETLAALGVFAKRFGPKGSPEVAFDMPGGEGPETRVAWNGAVQGSGLDVEAGSLPALSTPEHVVPADVAGQPELVEAAETGVIPKELDLRLPAGHVTSAPFQPEELARRPPAWR